MGLFSSGEFTYNSGIFANFKIECDYLTDDDWDTLTRMVLDRVDPFSSVEGVPTGGVKLADRLAEHTSQGPVLIVDDVMTTGHSMLKQRNKREAQGFVIFSHGLVQLDWVQSLFTLQQTLHTVKLYGK